MRHTLLIGLLTLVIRPVSAENLVANPGFEAGEDTPTGWSFNHRGTDGEITWDDGRAASGERSVRLANVKGQTGNVVQTIRIDPPLPPGSRVDYAAMSATQEASTAPTIIMYLQPPGGARQTVVARGAGGTHDFTEVTGTDVTDRPVASIVIYLCHYGTGTAWWDDARVSVEPAEPVVVLDRPAATAQLPALTTADGLSLTLTDAGGVSAVRAGGADLIAPGMRAGLWVRPWRGDLTPVAGEVAAGADGVRQQWRSVDLGLEVNATWAVEGDAISCRGEIIDLTGEERGVDLIAALPVGAAGEGWLWGESVVEALPLWEAADEGAQPVASHRGFDNLTFTALTRPDDAGLSLAVPADSPCICGFEWTSEFGLAVRFQLGLSPDASGELRSRAPFAFVIYRIDPAWGLRDAARRYQEMNAWAFEKRVEREGLWMFGQPRIDLPDPELYAFHEGGPAGWEYDDEHGIYTCPYVIPGQREIKHLDRLPADAAEALEIFHGWRPGEDARARGWGNASMKAIIESCMLHDAEGRPVVEIRDTQWGGKSITFPLNANPWLYESDDALTVAKAVLDGVRALHDEIPALDGTYVDSLGHWGNFVSFRREHFAAERVPLTCDAATGRPVIDNRFTLLEFLWELRDFLHERGKLLFANGVHPNRRFHFFALDILGVEGRSGLEHKRTMAGAKPFLLLIYNIEDDPEQMEYWFNLCAHWGIYPSFGNMSVFDTPDKYAPVAALNRRYVPAMQIVTRAGWRPVTNAVSDRFMIERWGPGEEGEVCLTVYNPAQDPIEGEVTVDAAALGLAGATLTAEDLLDGDTLSAPIANGVATLRLPIDAQRVRILRLSTR